MPTLVKRQEAEEAEDKKRREEEGGHQAERRGKEAVLEAAPWPRPGNTRRSLLVPLSS